MIRSYLQFRRLWWNGILFAVSLAVFACGHTSSDKTGITTSSGLFYQILTPGTGDIAGEGQEVLVHEKVTYPSGKLIYNTHDVGSTAKFRIGANQAISGVDEGVRGMQVGEVRRMIIPPHLSKRTAYPDILSPDSTLVYVIELVEILP